MNISGTGNVAFTFCRSLAHARPGYKLRTHIAQALKTRSTAIRKSVERFNHLAKQVAPASQLEISDVLNYAIIREFELLRESRQDVRDKVWTRPAYRDGMDKFFKLRCARSEIRRLDVEVKRLATHIHDEEEDYCAALQATIQTNPGLANEISLRWQYRSAVNKDHCERLVAIAGLTGSTADIDVGSRVARVSPMHLDAPSNAAPTIGPSQHVPEEEEEEEEGHDGALVVDGNEDIILQYSDFIGEVADS